MYVRVKKERFAELITKASPANEDGLAELLIENLTAECSNDLAENIATYVIKNMDLADYLEDNDIELDYMFNEKGQRVYSIKNTPEFRNFISECSLFIDLNNDNRLLMVVKNLYCMQYDSIEALLNAFPTQLATLFREGMLEGVSEKGDKKDYESILSGSNEEVAFKLLMERDGVDNPDLYSDIGVCFEQGCGTEEDLSQARKYYEIAAAKGSSYARVNLAKMYLTGNGVKKCVNRAICLLTEASLMQDIDAIEILALVYQCDDYVPKNLYLSVSYSKIGSDLGSSFCAEIMGDAYYNGLGIKKDLDGAVFYYQKLDEENPSRLSALGTIYFDHSEYGISQEEALEMLTKASKLGNSNASYKLSQIYGSNAKFKDLDKSLKYYSLYEKQAGTEE